MPNNHPDQTTPSCTTKSEVLGQMFSLRQDKRQIAGVFEEHLLAFTNTYPVRINEIATADSNNSTISPSADPAGLEEKLNAIEEILGKSAISEIIRNTIKDLSHAFAYPGEATVKIKVSINVDNLPGIPEKDRDKETLVNQQIGNFLELII